MTFALKAFGLGLALPRLPSGSSHNCLEIDHVFVRTFVQAIHRVRRMPGLKTLAEFVEHAATKQPLRGMGASSPNGMSACQGR
ncbi:MAG: hypothetical protein ABWU16_00710 [Halothiobacillaceae bacterium]